MKSELLEILERLWVDLHHAAGDTGAPMNTPVVATVTRQGTAEARTVILRGAERENWILRFYTDVRSPKFRHLEAEPRGEMVFYDSHKQVQIRARFSAGLYRDGPLAAHGWRSLAPHERWRYLTREAPGTLSAVCTSGLPEPDGEGVPEEGPASFAVVECMVQELDWLDVSGEAHRRAQFYRDGDRVEGQWVYP